MAFDFHSRALYPLVLPVHDDAHGTMSMNTNNMMSRFSVGNKTMRFLFQCLLLLIINICKQAMRVLCRFQAQPHYMQ